MHLHSDKMTSFTLTSPPQRKKNKQSRSPYSETADHMKPKRKILQDAPGLNFESHDVVAAATLSRNNFSGLLIGVLPFLSHKASISCLPVSNDILSLHLDAQNVSTTYFDFQASSRPTHPICKI